MFRPFCLASWHFFMYHHLWPKVNKYPQNSRFGVELPRNGLVGGFNHLQKYESQWEG